MGHHQLDELDYKILKLVALERSDTISRSCKGMQCVGGPLFINGYKKLTNLGILKGSEYIIDSNKIGFETCAYMGFYLKNPGDFSHVVEELRKIPEVVECHFTTGQYDMFIKLFARNNQHLLEIIHTKLQPIGLSRTETLISFREIFRRQLPIEEVEDLD